jgi:hypothetical protein
MKGRAGLTVVGAGEATGQARERHSNLAGGGRGNVGATQSRHQTSGGRNSAGWGARYLRKRSICTVYERYISHVILYVRVSFRLHASR